MSAWPVPTGVGMTVKQAIRRSFERAAPTYEAAASLQKEIARRLDDHLEEMRIEPKRILDAGCGPGIGFDLLRARYPQAELIGLDLALAMLQQARGHAASPTLFGRLAKLWQSVPEVRYVCGDIEALPLAKGSVDLIWSNLALQWATDLPGALRQLRRALRPEGLLLFSTFGPDTLKELRAAFAGLDGHNHVNRFIDMHDIGDMLMHAGFAHPVMEMELITVTYADLKGVLRELKGIGAHTVVDGQRPGLMGRREWQRLSENYERFRREGRLPATFEVVYGHAWAGREDRREDGRQVIEFQIQQRKAGLR